MTTIMEYIERQATMRAPEQDRFNKMYDAFMKLTEKRKVAIPSQQNGATRLTQKDRSNGARIIFYRNLLERIKYHRDSQSPADKENITLEGEVGAKEIRFSVKNATVPSHVLEVYLELNRDQSEPNKYQASTGLWLNNEHCVDICDIPQGRELAVYRERAKVAVTVAYNHLRLRK